MHTEARSAAVQCQPGVNEPVRDCDCHTKKNTRLCIAAQKRTGSCASDDGAAAVVCSSARHGPPNPAPRTKPCSGCGPVRCVAAASCSLPSGPGPAECSATGDCGPGSLLECRLPYSAECSSARGSCTVRRRRLSACRKTLTKCVGCGEQPVEKAVFAQAAQRLACSQMSCSLQGCMRRCSAMHKSYRRCTNSFSKTGEGGGKISPTLHSAGCGHPTRHNSAPAASTANPANQRWGRQWQQWPQSRV